MCDKEPYPTERDAREAARGMSREHNQSMHYYFCDPCNCWHVATRRGRQRSRRNNNKYPFRYQPIKKKDNNKKKKR